MAEQKTNACHQKQKTDALSHSFAEVKTCTFSKTIINYISSVLQLLESILMINAGRNIILMQNH